MTQQIRLLDGAARTADLPEHGLLRGQVGAVIEALPPDAYEIEFVDKDGQTYAVLPLTAAQIMMMHQEPAKAA